MLVCAGSLNMLACRQPTWPAEQLQVQLMGVVGFTARHQALEAAVQCCLIQGM
jgi:hypothetical protein